MPKRYTAAPSSCSTRSVVRRRARAEDRLPSGYWQPGRGATVLAPIAAGDIRTALLNGIAANGELCEGSPPPAVAAHLAGICDRRARRMGGCMLGAFILGYEVAGRLNRGYTSAPFASEWQLSLLAAAAPRKAP